MTLTSAPVSTRKRKRLALSMIKNRRLGSRPEVLVANSTRPGCFPTKNRCALLGLVPKAAMVPAKSLGWGRGGGSGGTTGRGARAGAASAVGGELQRRDELSQLADLCSQFCNFGGDRGRWWRGDRSGWRSD